MNELTDFVRVLYIKRKRLCYVFELITISTNNRNYMYIIVRLARFTIFLFFLIEEFLNIALFV